MQTPIWNEEQRSHLSEQRFEWDFKGKFNNTTIEFLIKFKIEVKNTGKPLSESRESILFAQLSKHFGIHTSQSHV